MNITIQELYALLKGLNLVSSSNETSLTPLQVMNLQSKVENLYKEQNNELL